MKLCIHCGMNEIPYGEAACQDCLAELYFTCAKCGKSFKESHIHDCFECEQTFCDECFPVHRPFYTVSYLCSEFVEGFTVRVQADSEQAARETAQFLIDEEHPSAHHVITAIDKEEQ